MDEETRVALKRVEGALDQIELKLGWLARVIAALFSTIIGLAAVFISHWYWGLGTLWAWLLGWAMWWLCWGTVWQDFRLARFLVSRQKL